MSFAYNSACLLQSTSTLSSSMFNDSRGPHFQRFSGPVLAEGVATTPPPPFHPSVMMLSTVLRGHECEAVQPEVMCVCIYIYIYMQAYILGLPLSF
jgi:hypothetical protein